MVWFDKILRSLFGTIDGILGWAASTLYTLIVQIANVDIFGNYIYTMMGRIYTFLAIFMLFKLSISVVNYVLNPDQLTDKTKGFSKLIQNVIIVMTLVIMTPQLFNWAYKLQAAILNTNVLYTIVTGKKNDSSYNPSDLEGLTSEEIVAKLTANAKDSGDMIKYELLSTFIYNEYSEDEHTAVMSDGTLCNKETTGSYSAAYDCLMDGDTINNTSGSKHYGAKKGFTNEYKILVSTLCIGFAAYVFLVTAFDVALRCVKLGALQLMAPVPIISMLDPNSGKSGMFSKWLKECKNTYLSLFTRLISVYFAVEVIRGLTEPGRFVWYGTDVAVGFGFVKVFVILGLLMFAKQLPKFIEDATGIKMDTGGLNLKKKIGDIPLAGKPINKAAGFVGRSAGNLAKMGGRYLGKGVGFGAKILDNKTGGHVQNFITQGKLRSDQMRQKYRNFIDNHPLLQDADTTLSGIGLDAQSTLGINSMKKLEDKRKKLDDVQKQAAAILSRADSEMIKHESMTFTDAKGNMISMRDYKEAKERLALLRNNNISRKDYASDADYQTAVANHASLVNDLQTYVAKTQKEGQKAYVTAVMSGAINDEQTTNNVKGLQNTVSRSDLSEIRGLKVGNGSEIKNSLDAVENSISEVNRDINNRQQLIQKTNANTKQK